MPTTIPVTLEAGTLAPPACYSNEQERFEAYVTAMTAFISGTNLEWVVQSGTPAAGDQGKAWLRIDINGYPIEALFWVAAAGTWVRWFTVPKYPASSGGVANALTITFNPTVLTRAVGDRFWFIAAATSTGATTLAIDSLAAAPIVKNGSSPLAANDIKAGQVVEITWDGSAFQMLSQVGNSTSLVSNITPGSVGQILTTTTGPVTAWANAFSETALIPIPAAGASITPVAHGFGGFPGYVSWVAKCNTIDATAYPVGTEVDLMSICDTGGGDTNFVWSTWRSATELGLIRSTFAAGLLSLPHYTTGVLTTFTAASWDLKGYYRK